MGIYPIFVGMDSQIEKYLPAGAIMACNKLLAEEDVVIRIVNIRITRHGDYKQLPCGKHVITLNATPNCFRFLITLLHEIAHLHAFETYGRYIKPHGMEWKKTFQHLMLPFLRPEIFPSELLTVLAHHLRNPKASSSTDLKLALALKQFDPPTDTTLIFEIPPGSMFKLYNGKRFRRGQKRVKRIECVELSTGKMYLFQPHAEVVPLIE